MAIRADVYGRNRLTDGSNVIRKVPDSKQKICPGLPMWQLKMTLSSFLINQLSDCLIIGDDELEAP